MPFSECFFENQASQNAKLGLQKSRVIFIAHYDKKGSSAWRRKRQLKNDFCYKNYIKIITWLLFFIYISFNLLMNKQGVIPWFIYYLEGADHEIRHSQLLFRRNNRRFSDQGEDGYRRVAPPGAAKADINHGLKNGDVATSFVKFSVEAVSTDDTMVPAFAIPGFLVEKIRGWTL